MNPIRLSVEQAGPLTTYQDSGRPGMMRFGVPLSGPVDRLALAAANVALGNAPGATAIEISGGGLTLVGGAAPLAFALVGGEFTAAIDGTNVGSHIAATLPAGARLTIRDGCAGNWACLALAGHITAPAWLGSTATHALAGLGGGRIAAGDTITVETESPRFDTPIPLPPPPPADGPIRVVIGPQERYFDPGALDLLAKGPWRIGAAFDRMGIVLDGPALVPMSLAMLSDPLVRGTLQVNGSGTATVLLADHQSTGGYPRIATIISADVDRLAQLRPGTPVSFMAVSVGEAIAAARRRRAAIADFLDIVANPASLDDRLRHSNLIGGVINASDPS
jgi:biotin-dependent carboxylase-like uncharacterized protein